ncbi:hypothetical protein QYE76_069506 [Lolium multiflorum]|uniref:Uncharacterized protein n=1 Tax=Lolium multiflorum TaxID=4521 RepID=A0AAD8SHW4_LOLMU|nr:hypothetical protein QYE76_069506 [Lolium multiflorum]
MAKMAFLLPVCFGKSATSVVRSFYGSDAERFARSKASVVVHVFGHGCSVLSSLLLSGEEDRLDCNSKLFSEVLSTNARDICTISLFHGVLCNKIVPPLLF